MFITLALAALLFEGLIGYPQRVYDRVGHPVSWIGWLIARLDRGMNRPSASFAIRRCLGIAALLIVLAVTAAVAALVIWAAEMLPAVFGFVVLAMCASTLLASRSLAEHVGEVADAFDAGGLASGRDAVSRIVGRDPASLDEAGVCRAAIESLAENFSDGVVAPLFWLAVAGLPGAAAYKAINTADSMIGHMSERHRAFGWAAARLDDVVNLPGSRLAVVWLAGAAAVTPGASASDALRAVARDAGRHSSPNAGWPEAAMAGALGFRLAGPRSYAGAVVSAAWMGDGRADLVASDIRRALSLYRTACRLQAGSLAVLALLLNPPW